MDQNNVDMPEGQEPEQVPGQVPEDQEQAPVPQPPTVETTCSSYSGNGSKIATVVSRSRSKKIDACTEVERSRLQSHGKDAEVLWRGYF